MLEIESNHLSRSKYSADFKYLHPSQQETIKTIRNGLLSA